MKKFASFLLSIIMLITAVSGCLTAFAQVSFDADKNAIVVDEVGEFSESRIYENIIIGSSENAKYSVEFAEGVEILGQDVMAGCQQLEAVYIPKSVTTIKKGCFSDCDNLKTIYYAGTKAEWKQIRIEREGNEDFRDASVKYGEIEDVNYASLYACIGAVVALGVCLTVVATRKSRKK